MYSFYDYMQDGGMPQMKKDVEPNGEMALGQMAAVQDKMNKLLQFVKPNDNLDPWIASKLAVMDHSADAIADYLMYGDEGDEIEETEEMKEGGGIPPRYKNMGFTKVGAKRQSNRPGKKWMVLAKKGSQYKVVHGGYKGMKDFTQHGSEKRRKNFWNRMGGKSSSKATDPFSPLYWHKRFGTWKDGGETYNMENGGMMFREVPTGDISIPNLTQMQVGGYFPRFMEYGGSLPIYQSTGSVNIPLVGFGKRCAMGSDADGNCIGGERAIGYDDMQKQLWKERTNLYEGLKGEDKRAKKAAYEAALAENPGLTPEMYAMADWDAWSYNSGIKNYKNTIDPNTGMVPDSATVPSQFKYFINNKLIQNSGRPASYKDMINIYNQLEGGFEGGYKPLFMSGYRQQKKMGGINNPGFKALPSRVQRKIISRMEDGGYSDTYSGGVYYQQGGMPQQASGQEEQIMQIIQAYAQIAQIDPNEVMQQLQQMQPEEQQQAIQQMVQTVQQASGGGGQEQMQEQPQMKSGGMPCYNCGGMYQYGGQMGGSYMPSIPAVSVYDLPIYQEGDQYQGDVRWHPEWNQQYSDSAMSGVYDEDAAVAQANAEALAQYPGPQMQRFAQQSPGYQGNSIVDYLANAGSDSSYASRKALAAEKGIQNYRGTAAQNLELLDVLRGGKNTIPTGRVTARSAAKKAENNSSTSEAEENAFTYNPKDGNVLRGGWDRSLPSFKGDFQKASKSDSKSGNNNLAWAGAGLATLIGASALTAKELAEVKQAFLNNDFSKSFAPSVKRKLTMARKALANQAMSTGDKAAMEAVNEFDRLPKRLQKLLSNLDEMEIAGDIYQTRKGTASRGLETWNAMNESRAEESIMNQQDLMRMEQEAAEEAKAIRSDAARKAAAKRYGKNPTPAQIAAEESRFIRSVKSGYNAMREAPMVTKLAKLAKYFRKEDGGYINDDIDMMQVGGQWNVAGYNVPDWMKTGVQVLDPTGISSYGDVYDDWNDPNVPAWEAALTTVSALPIVGKLGKAAKATSKLGKAYKTAQKVLSPVSKMDRMNPVGAGVGAFNRTMLQGSPKAARVAAQIGSDFNQGRRFFTAGEAAISGLDNMMGYTPQQAYGGYMDPAWMAYGGININPANRGKFTASAQRAGMGVQEFANKVLANKEDYSATQVKRANFARNAAKWKKQEGGSIGVGSYVDDTPEMRAWLDANGYTYE